MNAEDEKASAVELDWAEAADRLERAAEDDGAWYAAVAGDLVGSGDLLAIDVGCGGAGMAIALARRLTDEGRVLAIDGDDEVLQGARRTIAAAGSDASRVAVHRIDLHGGLGGVAELIGSGGVDVIWASGVVHHLGDQQQAIDHLAGLLAPGGRLALAEGGLGVRHLPWDVGVGQQGLEVRLTEAFDRWFLRMRQELPQAVRMPYGWPAALRAAGLASVSTSTTVLERPTPLEDAQRRAIAETLSWRVERATSIDAIPPADLDAWGRLLDEVDAAWIGRRDDLYDLSARSVHVGYRQEP